jgi:hypothetical protein
MVSPQASESACWPLPRQLLLLFFVVGRGGARAEGQEGAIFP